MLHTLVWGNAYAEIERAADGRPKALWPIAPHRVRTEHVDGLLRYRVVNTTKADVILAASDVLHFKGPSLDGVIGIEVIDTLQGRGPAEIEAGDVVPW